MKLNRTPITLSRLRKIACGIDSGNHNIIKEVELFQHQGPINDVSDKEAYSDRIKVLLSGDAVVGSPLGGQTIENGWLFTSAKQKKGEFVFLPCLSSNYHHAYWKNRTRYEDFGYKNEWESSHIQVCDVKQGKQLVTAGSCVNGVFLYEFVK